VVLTIAGSDSGGGAGVQADLRTFAALGVHGTTAITAVTAQSSIEVRGIHALPPEFVRLQVETVLADITVDVVKTGMLASGATAREVARLLGERRLMAVVDPVLGAGSGAALLAGPELVEVLRTELLPLARVFTPNLSEVAAILGAPEPRTPGEMIAAAQRLGALGARAVLIKGGHLAGAPVDVLLEAGSAPVLFESERVEGVATHGTGCTYASAIAAELAQGAPLPLAIRAAQRFVLEAIRAAGRAPPIGRGQRHPVQQLHAQCRFPAGLSGGSGGGQRAEPGLDAPKSEP
jgi:hydroxymethylpyrimidine/phosphomethylpyrimidine kinase